MAYTTVNNYGNAHTQSWKDNEDVIVAIVDVNVELRLEGRVYYQNPGMTEARAGKSAVVFTDPQEALNFAAMFAQAAQDFAAGAVQAAPKAPSNLPAPTVTVQGLTPKGTRRSSTKKTA